MAKLAPALVVLAAWSAPAQANVGHRDQSFSSDSSVVAPTGQKPQSKLWFHDGSWWASMFVPGTGSTAATNGAFHIHRLNTTSQTWEDTGTVLDDRNSSEADILSVGDKLYVASSSDSTSGLPFYRYSYDPVLKKYTLDPGFPVDISSTAGPVEAIVMDRDSLGHVWVTYTAPLNAARTVFVAHTTTSDANWSDPYALPFTDATNLNSPGGPDDISSVVSFSGKIGVMWSNQTDQKMHFAEHVDGAGDAGTDWTEKDAYDNGPRSADDHINLKSLEADPAGRVFAAVKTSFGDAPGNGAQPQVNLLVRDSSGNWTPHPFGTVDEDHTRPIVLTDQHARKIYVLATSPTSAPTPPATNHQTIYYKEANLDDPIFAPGPGTPFIQGDGVDINNVSSTKQDLSNIPNLVGIASDDANNFYWHGLLDLGHATSTTPTTPGTTPPPPGGSPATVIAPTIGQIALKPKSFKPSRRRASIAAAGGTRVSFRLSEKARVGFRVERRAKGRRVGRFCVAGRGATGSRASCVRYVLVRGSFAATGKAGANRVLFTGHLRRKALAAGRYRLVLTATDAAGHRSSPHRAAFRIVR